MSGLVSLRRITKIDDHKNIVYPSTIHMVSLTTGWRSSDVSSCSMLLWNRISSRRKNSKQPNANRKITNTTKCTVGYSQYGDGFMVCMTNPSIQAYKGFQYPFTAIFQSPRK